MTANATLAAVFSWFQNITSSCTLLNWSIISINHISMSRALRAQGYTRDDLPYKLPEENLPPIIHYFSLSSFC